MGIVDKQSYLFSINLEKKSISGRISEEGFSWSFIYPDEKGFLLYLFRLSASSIRFNWVEDFLSEFTEEEQDFAERVFRDCFEDEEERYLLAYAMLGDNLCFKYEDCYWKKYQFLPDILDSIKERISIEGGVSPSLWVKCIDENKFILPPEDVLEETFMEISEFLKGFSSISAFVIEAFSYTEDLHEDIIEITTQVEDSFLQQSVQKYIDDVVKCILAKIKKSKKEDIYD